MQPWFSETRKIPSLQAEICFPIQKSLYYGPEGLPATADRTEYTAALHPPAIGSVLPSLVRTSEAFGQERELAAYYEQIVRLASLHRRPFSSIQQHFWLRFWLWNSEYEVHLTFPWYNSYREIDRYLHALVTTDTGLIDHDMDQGWELQSYAHEGTLYFLERDPDCDETRLAISVPRKALIEQVQTLRKRTEGILTRLSDLLGADVWSAPVHSEPVFRIEQLRNRS